MKVIQVDGTARQYVFEDGSRVSFFDFSEYARLKHSGTGARVIEQAETIEPKQPDVIEPKQVKADYFKQRKKK